MVQELAALPEVDVEIVESCFVVLVDFEVVAGTVLVVLVLLDEA